MAALGRVSRLLLGAAVPRSLPARGAAAAAAHEEGGGNGVLRGEGGAGARGWRSAALDTRCPSLRERSMAGARCEPPPGFNREPGSLLQTGREPRSRRDAGFISAALIVCQAR